MITDKNFQKQKADNFLAQHKSSEILILQNVWDAASTKIFEKENYKAVGTTSAGIAAVLGYPDGQQMRFDESLPIIKRIIECTNLPVSVDIEAGYSDAVSGVVETAQKALELGAVGINLEDSTGDHSKDPSKALYDIQTQCEKISAIRKMSEKEDINFVINARTDVFLLSTGSINDKISYAVERANGYKEAGADCIFVPDMGDFSKNIIQSLVNKINAPVNIIAGANTPSISELEKIGVSRVSFGPRVMRAAFDLIRRIAKEIQSEGTYKQIAEVNITYSEVNQWFKNN